MTVHEHHGGLRRGWVIAAVRWLTPRACVLAPAILTRGVSEGRKAVTMPTRSVSEGCCAAQGGVRIDLPGWRIVARRGGLGWSEEARSARQGTLAGRGRLAVSARGRGDEAASLTLGLPLDPRSTEARRIGAGRLARPDLPRTAAARHCLPLLPRSPRCWCTVTASTLGEPRRYAERRERLGSAQDRI